MVYRGNHSNVDHVFISCLESRFRGAWDTVAGGLVYKAKDDDAQLDVIMLDRTKKMLGFSKGAYVTVFETNVITYDAQDADYLTVDEEARGKSMKRPTP